MITESEEETMSKFYEVEITDAALYTEIEANSPEEAIQIALEWWIERKPKIVCEEVNEPFT